MTDAGRKVRNRVAMRPAGGPPRFHESRFHVSRSGVARAAALVVGLAVVLAGCDSSTEPDRAARGDMTVLVSGDLERELPGGALHISTQLSGSPDGIDEVVTRRVQAINFLPDAEEVARFELVRVASEPEFDDGGGIIGRADPLWGTFEPGVVEDEWILFATVQDLDGYSGLLYSVDGTLELPEASGQGQITGSLVASMEGELELEDATQFISVEVEIVFESLPSTGGF